jgi:fused signal recognition particle receptor
VEQEVLDSIRATSEYLVNLVHTQPELLVNSLAGLLACSLLLLLVALRRSRRLRDQVHQLSKRVAQLESELAPSNQVVQSLSMPREAVTVTAETAEPIPATAAVEAHPVETPPVAEVAAGKDATVIPTPAAAEETALSRGLKKSRAGFLSRLTGFFSGRATVDTSTLDDLEELLILSDVGARCASDLVGEVKKAAEHSPQGVSSTELTTLLKSGIQRRLVPVSRDHQVYRPTREPLIILVVGVNGVGKTTTVAKLATKYMEQGKKVLAVAADTFRAAAVEQLAEWSSRVGFTLVRGAENAKPSAVVFDGMVAAKEGGFDVVLIDTAGRLHTKSNLMQELEGVRNSIRKHFPDGPHETILVLDGVSGQNALSQAREFNQAVSLTGIVVTKLDGTPKGGIIVAISQELSLPVFFIGVGEKVDDLLVFDPGAFVAALFEEDVRNASQEVDVVSRVSNQ